MSSPAQPMAIDWFRVIWDLAQREWSMPRVAKQTGIAVQTLYDYRDGGHPVHWRGELMLELWCAVCGQARVDAPTVPIVLTPRVVHTAPTVQADGEAVLRLEKAWRVRA